MNAIEITNLSKTFKGKRGNRVEALKDLSLTVQQGEVFGFLGPNGAGKSTTIKILMGPIKPSAGNAAMMGHPISSHLCRRSIGYLPENPSFYDFLNAEEYLSFVGKTFGMSGAKLSGKINEALTLMDLLEARKRQIRSYSKGMVQRLGLAQVLVHDPELYILDEPMSGLDPLGRILVRDVILDLKSRGKCVFMSTHILHDIEAICDRAGVIVKGELRFVDSIKNVMLKGIRGYQISFNTLSGAVVSYMESIGAFTDPKDQNTFLVRNDSLKRTLSMIAGDPDTSIRIIEPIREGLEELFTKLVHES